MHVKAQVIVWLWYSEEYVRPKVVVGTLQLLWEVFIRDSVMGGEIQVVGSACIKDDFRVPYVWGF